MKWIEWEINCDLTRKESIIKMQDQLGMKIKGRLEMSATHEDGEITIRILTEPSKKGEKIKICIWVCKLMTPAKVKELSRKENLWTQTSLAYKPLKSPRLKLSRVSKKPHFISLNSTITFYHFYKEYSYNKEGAFEKGTLMRRWKENCELKEKQTANDNSWDSRTSKHPNWICFAFFLAFVPPHFLLFLWLDNKLNFLASVMVSKKVSKHKINGFERQSWLGWSEAGNTLTVYVKISQITVPAV